MQFMLVLYEDPELMATEEQRKEAVQRVGEYAIREEWPRLIATALRITGDLQAVQDTPVVALNRAVAVAMADGPAAALPALDELAGDPALAGSHRVWAVRADVNRRLGRVGAALADYDHALELVSNQAERRYLTQARQQAEEVAGWVRRPRAFAGQPPAKKPEQKKG